MIIVTDAGYGKRTKSEHFHRQGRGGQGVRAIKLTAVRGRVVAAFMAGLDDQILLVSSGGVVIRTAVREIAAQGRDATGVQAHEPRRRPERCRRGDTRGLGRRGRGLARLPSSPAPGSSPGPTVPDRV